MRKSGYILVVAVLFFLVAKGLKAIDFWGLVGLAEPHGFLIQGFVFLVVLFVLQNALFEPYLKVMEEREAQTSGKRQQAEKTRQEAQAMIEKYQKTIEEVRLRAVKERELKGLEAEEEEQKRILRAKDEARNRFMSFMKELEQETQNAQSGLKNSIDLLSTDIVNQVLQESLKQKNPHSASSLR